MVVQVFTQGFSDIEVPAYAIKREGSLSESFGGGVVGLFSIWPGVE